MGASMRVGNGRVSGRRSGVCSAAKRKKAAVKPQSPASNKGFGRDALVKPPQPANPEPQSAKQSTQPPQRSTTLIPTPPESAATAASAPPQQLPQQQSHGATTTAAEASELSVSGKPIGWRFFDNSTESDSSTAHSTAQAGVQRPSTADTATTASKAADKDGNDVIDDNDDVGPMIDFVSGSSDAVAQVTRDDIMRAVLSTSAILTALGFALRGFAVRAPTALGTFADADAINRLLVWPSGVAWTDVGVAVVAAAAVTAARGQLYKVWPAFKESTDRANTQVLTPLAGPLDILVVACLPGATEELLFRGGLVPALGGGPAAAIASAIAFGVLHRSGGRGWDFAAWASGVGMLYGAIYLGTGNLYVPMAAHAFANYSSALAWLAARESTSR